MKKKLLYEKVECVVPSEIVHNLFSSKPGGLYGIPLWKALVMAGLLDDDEPKEPHANV